MRPKSITWSPFRRSSVSTSTCFVPQGEIERAGQLQSKLTPFAAAVTTRFGIGGLNAALDRSGYVGGVVRTPLAAPNEEQCAEILELLSEVQKCSEYNSRISPESNK